MDKIFVNTTHELSVDDDSSNGGVSFSGKVDSDSTVKLNFSIGNGDTEKDTPWLSREDLLRLRRLINKALSLIS